MNSSSDRRIFPAKGTRSNGVKGTWRRKLFFFPLPLPFSRKRKKLWKHKRQDIFHRSYNPQFLRFEQDPCDFLQWKSGNIDRIAKFVWRNMWRRILIIMKRIVGFLDSFNDPRLLSIHIFACSKITLHYLTPRFLFEITRRESWQTTYHA